jgi:hypothetical protein
MPSADVSDPEMGGDRGSYIFGDWGGGDAERGRDTCCGEAEYTGG